MHPSWGRTSHYCCNIRCNWFSVLLIFGKISGKEIDWNSIRYWLGGRDFVQWVKIGVQSRGKGRCHQLVVCFFLCPDSDCSRTNLSDNNGDEESARHEKEREKRDFDALYKLIYELFTESEHQNIWLTNRLPYKFYNAYYAYVHSLQDKADAVSAS